MSLVVVPPPVTAARVHTVSIFYKTKLCRQFDFGFPTKNTNHCIVLSKIIVYAADVWLGIDSEMPINHVAAPSLSLLTAFSTVGHRIIWWKLFINKFSTQSLECLKYTYTFKDKKLQKSFLMKQTNSFLTSANFCLSLCSSFNEDNEDTTTHTTIYSILSCEMMLRVCVCDYILEVFTFYILQIEMFIMTTYAERIPRENAT